MKDCNLWEYNYREFSRRNRFTAAGIARLEHQLATMERGQYPHTMYGYFNWSGVNRVMMICRLWQLGKNRR
jgi:hypothetical protein